MTSEPSDEDIVRTVAATGAREVAQSIQSKIQEKAGRRITEGELQQIIEPAMTEVVQEITIQASHHYSGPMPSPQVMQGYVQLYPQAAAQLFEQFKEEQDHRHQWENKALSDNSAERKRRDLGAYFLVSLGIAAACYLAYLGAHTTAAFLIGALVLGGGALVFGRQLLMMYNKDGAVVQVHSDEQNGHSSTRSQKASQKQKSRTRSPRQGR